MKLFLLLAPVLPLLMTGCSTPSSPSSPVPSLADAKSHFASYGSNKVHYLTVGHGPQTLLFIHGWACSSTFWREQIPALAGRAKLLLIDLPGHGQSDKPDTAYTMDFFAGAVLAVLRDAHAEKAVLIGHSMGTPVICRIYAQAPERVAALVAVDGPLRRPKMNPAQASQFIAAYSTPDYRDSLKRFAESMFPNPGTEVLRDRVVADMSVTPQHVMHSAMEGMFGSSQPAWDLEKVTVPVLAINAKSPMWTPEYETYVRSLSPQTDYRIIDGAGHFVMLEKPAEFNAALIDSLEHLGVLAR